MSDSYGLKDALMGGPGTEKTDGLPASGGPGSGSVLPCGNSAVKENRQCTE